MVAPSIPLMTPITPSCKKSPCPSYCTPSPSPSSQHSVPSPIQTPGMRFLQEEGERLSQSDDSMSPTKAEHSAKRKPLLEQKISDYTFTSSQIPLAPHDILPPIEPFMSSAGHSTSSPQIVLRRPSPSEDPKHASFVSPNRTCYLSPTGMALSSTVLGFHQSPAHTDSDNTDLEGDVSEPSIIQTKTAVNIALEAANDTAVHDTEESIEAIQAHLAQSCHGSITHCLSDESNTASLPQAALTKQQSIPDDILDRVSPEFPVLSLSDDSEDESMEVSVVESSSIRNVTKLVNIGSYPKVKSDEVLEDTTSQTFTPRKPRRVALTTTSRRSPLKNDSTNFELQHDANNLDMNLTEEASHLLETGGLGAEASIDLGLEDLPEKLTPSDKKESVTITIRKSPRKRKNFKSPKAKAKTQPTKPSDAGCSAASDTTPPSKRQKMPEKAEFHEGEELSLMFSPQKLPGVSIEQENFTKDGKLKYNIKSTNIQPNQLPSVSVNIQKILLPAPILAPDSPTKSISLPPTPDSPARSIASRSPTPTICKALGLQRSGSKPKVSEETSAVKDPNRSWAEAIWGLGKFSGKSKVVNVNPALGVGDGQETRGRRGRKEVKSEDEEWTPEINRSNSKVREESNERMAVSKKVNNDDVDPILLQLRMNKPKTGSRNRSKSRDKSKDNISSVRRRSPSGNRTERKSREQKKVLTKLEEKSKVRSDKSSSSEPAKLVNEKPHPSSHQVLGSRHENRISPKRTRSRDKLEKEGSSEKLKSKSQDSKDQKQDLPKLTRKSSRDKIKVGTVDPIAAAKSKNAQKTISTVPSIPKMTRSTSGSGQDKKAEDKNSSNKVPREKPVEKVTKSQKEHSKGTVGTMSTSSPVKTKGVKTVPTILNKVPQKDKPSEPRTVQENETNIIEELQAAEMRDTKSPITPKEPSYGITNNKSSKDQSKETTKNAKPINAPKKIEVILDDDTEVITSAPLDIDLLAEKSAMILSSLSRLGTTESVKGDEEEVVLQPSNLEDPDSPEPLSEAKPVISRSPFFVLQNKLPFGVFEEDLQ
eukprot:GFUD01040680.1.p1 GENE.GFUD01040680.1~~GFUD01040680.1.p1  ORF type:complete len:1045 (+),score=253.27 GFUD01040680.1:877-4011(+)